MVGVVVAGLAMTDLGPFEDPATPEEEVSGAVEDFYGAAAEGDFKGFCALLTEQARAQPARSTTAAASSSRFLAA